MLRAGRPIRLSPAEKEELAEALISAFPSQATLRRMLDYKLGLNLERIAGNGSLDDIVQQIITRAESRNELRELLAGAHDDNPKNSLLSAFYHRYFSLIDPNAPARVLERLIRPALPSVDVAQWRDRLSRIERQVCRVEVNGSAMGTGFLIGPSLVLTNFHVVEPLITQKVKASAIKLRFDFAVQPGAARAAEGVAYGLAEPGVLDFSPSGEEDDKRLDDGELLDMALLAVQGTPGRERGYIDIPEREEDFISGSPLLIVQHPNGGPLKLAFDTNSVLGLSDEGTRVLYRTNTESGSSGSPCFNIEWQLVALHQSGARLDPTIGNQGVPIARIRERMQKKGLLQPPSPPITRQGSVSFESAKPAQPPTQTPTEPKQQAPSDALRVMLLYAAKDASSVEQLQLQLTIIKRQEPFEIWTKSEILPGSHESDETVQSIERADILLLLLSSEFLAKFDAEIDRALQQKARGAVVVPIIVRSVDWKSSKLGHLQPLPRNGEAVRDAKNADKAWLEVGTGIRALIQQRRARKSSKEG